LRRRHREPKPRGAAVGVVGGSGRPLREFLHADDLADACLHLLAVPQPRWSEVLGGVSHLNVGSGEELSIAELARLIADAVGFRGALRFDATKPDGTPRKRLDTARLGALGWSATRPLAAGLAAVASGVRAY
ncbi:MAG: NAD-dependent epimerase/dehydratase family protein, partial [Inhella sp.]